jgi:acetylornithine deacetylase/succinyl-diaminopimelate desuccinylase-like protein
VPQGIPADAEHPGRSYLIVAAFLERFAYERFFNQLDQVVGGHGVPRLAVDDVVDVVAVGVERDDGQPAAGMETIENAVEKLLALAPYVKRIGNCRLNVPIELRPALRSSVNFLLSDKGLTEDQKKAVRRIFNYPTVALNVLNGGVKINVVPDAAEASFDIRLTPGIDLKKTKRQLLKLIEDSGIKGIETAVSYLTKE